MRVSERIARFAVTLVCAWTANVLSADSLEAWVARFNADDEETVTNAVPNAAAAAFLGDNIPLFECSDAEIERTYYFRWWTLRKHLKRTENGWVMSEFLPDVYWSGKHNTINCAAGHHFLEARWLRDKSIVKDYLRFYFRAGRMSGRGAYVSWPAFAANEIYRTDGDQEFVRLSLDNLAFNFDDWTRGWTVWAYGGKSTFDIGFDAGQGLFRVTDEFEGAENSCSGDGYRVLVNAAMYGEASAIAALAKAVGRDGLAAEFTAKANALAAASDRLLWNREREFFTTRAPDGRSSAVRELFGYAPWYFRMPFAGDRSAAWGFVLSEKGFAAPFGLTGVERTAQGFAIDYDVNGPACTRNGPTWPYETTIVLRALAEALRNGSAGAVTEADYVRLLHQYAAAHRLKRADGRVVSWIDEDLDPFTGTWLAREIFVRRGDPKKIGRSKDYNHSGFCDLVISGLCGVQPQADGTVDVKPLGKSLDWFRLSNVRCHGRSLTVQWDRTGSRYGQKGLKNETSPLLKKE